MKKFVIFLSVLVLAIGVLAGCTSEKKAATEQEKLEEQAETKQEKKEIQGPAEQEREKRTEVQTLPDYVGRQVIGNDDKLLGTITDISYIGEGYEYIYVLIQGDDDRVHPVPANLLEKSSADVDLKASFNQITFQQSPSFSKSEKEELSDAQLEEALGYYETKTL